MIGCQLDALGEYAQLMLFGGRAQTHLGHARHSTCENTKRCITQVAMVMQVVGGVTLGLWQLSRSIYPIVMSSVFVLSLC